MKPVNTGNDKPVKNGLGMDCRTEPIIPDRNGNDIVA